MTDITIASAPHPPGPMQDMVLSVAFLTVSTFELEPPATSSDLQRQRSAAAALEKGGGRWQAMDGDGGFCQ